jgi:hypothetical protein
MKIKPKNSQREAYELSDDDLWQHASVAINHHCICKACCVLLDELRQRQRDFARRDEPRRRRINNTTN